MVTANKVTHACAFGNAHCQKDNAQVICNTFGRYLNSNLMHLNMCKGLSIQNDDVVLSPLRFNNSSLFVPLEIFLASEILFCGIALEKEESAGWWCFVCDFMKDDWQTKNQFLHQ